MGRVWQITACDGSSSYGLAMLFVGESDAAVVAREHPDVIRHLAEGLATPSSDPDGSSRPQQMSSPRGVQPIDRW